MNAKIGTILVGAAVVLVGLLLYAPTRTPVPSVQTAPAVTSPAGIAPSGALHTGRSAPTVAAVPAEHPAPTNSIARLMKMQDVPKLTLEQVAGYLAENHRSVESLLGALRATGDKSLLEEAKEKFPNDPRVIYEAAWRSDLPEERRKWLDALKDSAPDNAMGNLLSAAQYFKSGQSGQAVQEVIAAGNKPIQDYSIDFLENAEEAYRAAGYSEGEAKAIASMSLLLPQLAQFKQVGVGLADTAKAYAQGGDQASAQASLEWARDLGQRLNDAGSTTLIQNLVGLAIQQIALNGMDPNATLGDAGQTVQSQKDAVQAQRQAIKTLAQQSEAILQTMTDQDLEIYFDRMWWFGEQGALRWAFAKYGPPPGN